MDCVHQPAATPQKNVKHFVMIPMKSIIKCISMDFFTKNEAHEIGKKTSKN